MNRLRAALPWLTGAGLLLASVLMARCLVAPPPPTPDVFERIVRDLPKDAPLAEVRAAVQVATHVLLTKAEMEAWSERTAAGEAPAEVLRSLVRQHKEVP